MPPTPICAVLILFFRIPAHADAGSREAEVNAAAFLIKSLLFIATER
jgi:hypothetical protein